MSEKMVKPISILLLLLLSGLVLAVAGSEPIKIKPRPLGLRSFKPRHPQIQKAVGRGCSYTVSIKTSCSSPRYTRDAIGLYFGDSYRNEVYAPRLDDPSTGTFERCSTDTFKLRGPCGYGICYLYLRRQGRDGWVPDWVKVYQPAGTVTFYYGDPIPNGVWYGFDHCDRATAVAASEIGRTGGDRIAKM